MHLWPIHTCQTFHLVQETDQSHEDINIIDTIALEQINAFIILTEQRVLIYQAKPFVPVLIYKRSDESLLQFGVNEKLYYNNPLKKIVAVNDNNTNLNLHENCIIYIKTNKNCLLVFEIKTFKNWNSSFKLYGIEPRLNNESIATKLEFIKKIPSSMVNNAKGIFHLQIDATSESNIDDELLTIFDIKNNGKIIQNGFIIEKGKNLVQIMKEMFFIKSSFQKKRSQKKIINNLVDTSNDGSENQEAEQIAEEMPIKVCDIILKTVLKFDDTILDMQVFTKYDGNNIRQEMMYLLYKNELCVLTLKEDYTLDAKHIVNNDNNCQLSFNGKDMFIASFDEKNTNLLIINKIDKKNNVIYSKDLILDNLKEYKLIKMTNFKERYLVLTFDKILLYYDTFLNLTYSKIKLLPTTGLLSELEKDKVVGVGSYDRELLTLLKQNGKFQIYTRWGNLQTEINLSKFVADQKLNYTNFSLLDNLLIAATDKGYIQIFDFYKQFKTSVSDFKSNSSYTLFNCNTNRITTFTSNKMFQYYLPTNSINNIITEMKYNGNEKFCLIYIANKNIVLVREQVAENSKRYSEITNLPLLENVSNENKQINKEVINLLNDFSLENTEEYDGWLVFENMDVAKIDWVGSRYAFIHMNDLDNSNYGPSIVCLDFKKLDLSRDYRSSIVHLLEMKIWAYKITEDDEVLNWGCNTFSNMKKFVKNDSSEKELFKLGEFNVLLKDKRGCVRLETIDLLVYENDDQVRSFVRNVVDLSKMPESLISYKNNVKWICHLNKGTVLIYTGDDELHKITTNKNGVLNSSILFTKLEEIIEINDNKISLVTGNDLVTCNIDFLMSEEPIQSNNLKTFFKQPLINSPGEYPIMVDNNLVEFDSLKCIYSNKDDVVNGFKLVISKNMVLDKVVKKLLNNSDFSIDTINAKYFKSKYYRFCLEKLLSDCVTEETTNAYYKTRLVELIKLFGSNSAYSDIEIFVNCIRKIDYQEVFKLIDIIKYNSIDKLISDVLDIDSIHQKCYLLSKIIIIKFNIDKKIDKELLSTTISFLMLDVKKNSASSNVEKCYKMIHQLVSYINKFKEDNESIGIEKDFIISLITSN
ncbi:hypothetical protein QEN19_000210 [Hanseniaspora menglaensis]